MCKSGFSILEVMVAVAIISSLGLGIYKLQLGQLAALQQLLSRQLMLQSASNLANQIYTHLTYCAPNSISRISSCSSTRSSDYVETSYTENISLGIDCALTSCSDAEYAAYTLYQWKTTFNNMNLPLGTIVGIVCRDSSFTIPTLSASGCNGSGGLVIKLVWQSHIESVEQTVLGENNYIMLPVAQR